MARSTDTPGRDELSLALRELRVAAGMSGTQAAKAAGFSQAKVSRIENGVNVPTPQDVRTLAGVYGARAAVRKRLEGLAEDVREEFRRVVLHRGAADFQQRVGRIEESSECIRTFCPTIVPGLLQTSDYARAVFTSGKLKPSEVDAAVTARLARQKLLQQGGRRFELVITEGALRWCARSPEIMAGQLDHIAAATRLPNTRIGIIAAGTPAGVIPLHNWDIYDRRAVIVGTTTATAVLNNRADVDAYRNLFGELVDLAVYDDDARVLLAAIGADYRAAALRA